MGAQHEILNHEGLVAFEARAGRDGPGLDDALLMNGQIGALGALAPAFARRTLLGQGLAGLLHAARLDLGPAFEPLETGDLVPLGRDGALQLGALDHERNHQRPEIRKRPRVQISGQSHARNQSEITPAGNPIRPDFRPSYDAWPDAASSTRAPEWFRARQRASVLLSETHQIGASACNCNASDHRAATSAGLDGDEE